MEENIVERLTLTSLQPIKLETKRHRGQHVKVRKGQQNVGMVQEQTHGDESLKAIRI